MQTYKSSVTLEGIPNMFWNNQKRLLNVLEKQKVVPRTLWNDHKWLPKWFWSNGKWFSVVLNQFVLFQNIGATISCFKTLGKSSSVVSKQLWESFSVSKQLGNHCLLFQSNRGTMFCCFKRFWEHFLLFINISESFSVVIIFTTWQQRQNSTRTRRRIIIYSAI